jgi:hypothetical protein
MNLHATIAPDRWSGQPLSMDVVKRMRALDGGGRTG